MAVDGLASRRQIVITWVVGSCHIDRPIEGGGELRLSLMALDQQVQTVTEVRHQLRRPEDPSMLTQPEHPGDELAGIGVRRGEDEVALLAIGSSLSVAAEMTLDLPGDAPADPDLGLPDSVAELPLDPVGVPPWIEVRRALKVVLGLGRIGHLAPHPGETEHANCPALVGASDQIELASLVEKLVGIDLPRPLLVAFHRVVVKDDRLAAEDGRLNLGQTVRHVVSAG